MNLEKYKKIVDSDFVNDPHNSPYYVVYDDFLSPDEYGSLKAYMTTYFPWNMTAKLNFYDQNPYLATLVYDNTAIARQEWNPHVDEVPFISITSKINMLALIRIKANMYLPKKTNEIHYPHLDYPFSHQGALYYLDDCNAPTYMTDGVAIESKANRILFFNPSTPHSSSAPTNVNFRQTINLNYFGSGLNSEWLHKSKNPTIVSDHVPFPIQPSPR